MIIIALAIFNVLEAGNGSGYYGRSYNPPRDLDISHLRFGRFQRPQDTILRLSFIDETSVLGLFPRVENDFVEAIFIHHSECFALRKIYFVIDGSRQVFSFSRD